MSLTPVDWSVVVAGRWNRAILTPAGIAKHLFGNPNAPIEVLIPIDVIAPPRVKHDGIVVVASSDTLQFIAEKCSFSAIAKARELAKRALDELPKTPIMAVGINTNFAITEALPEIANVVDSEWDDELSEEDFAIAERETVRQLIWGDASINVRVASNAEGQSVKINFNLASDDPKRQDEWLTKPIEEFEDAVTKLICNTMKIPLEELSYAPSE